MEILMYFYQLQKLCVKTIVKQDLSKSDEQGANPKPLKPKLESVGILSHITISKF
jgi:hypothetical protein